MRRPSFLAVGRVARYRSDPAKEEARRCWLPGLVADHAFERAEIISGRSLRTCDDAIPWELWGELWGALFRSDSDYPWPISPAPNRSCSPA